MLLHTGGTFFLGKNTHCSESPHKLIKSFPAILIESISEYFSYSFCLIKKIIDNMNLVGDYKADRFEAFNISGNGFQHAIANTGVAKFREGFEDQVVALGTT